MRPPQVAATNAHGKDTHAVAQLKLPSAATEELTTTAGGEASAQEMIMRETSVRMLITPGDSSTQWRYLGATTTSERRAPK